MRVRVRAVLFALLLGVAGSTLAVAAFSTRSGLHEDLFASYRAELERSLRLADLVLRQSELEPVPLAADLARHTAFRITIIGAEGTVLADSEVASPDLPRVENHGDRPEVRGALAGDMTTVLRRSGTLGVEHLYAALASEVEGRPVVLRVAGSLEGLEAVAGRNRRVLWLSGLLAVAVSFLAAHLFGRALTDPLHAVGRSALAVARGDFRTRVPRTSRLAEADELAQGFNRATEELGERVNDLVRLRDETGELIDSIAEGVVALTDDARFLRINPAAMELLELPPPPPFAPVGALVRQPELRSLLETSVVRPLGFHEIQVGERHLAVSSRPLARGGAVVTFLDVSELRRIERVRRDFVANASHELKTPLTSIRGFAEALLEEEPPQEMRARFLTSIHANTLRLQHLVDDLLDLSRLESGAWHPEIEAVDLAELARQAWEECLDREKGRGIAFAVRGECVFEGDRPGLSQIFRNLFDNALRHTPDGGRIDVEILEQGGHVRVAVRDNGSGIASEALPRIFERFYRADPARARRAGGTGLGLAIVRHLVSTMGGTVEAESELGVGTTIRFGFPLNDLPRS